MTQKYTGLCLGGPLDGQTVTRYQNVLHIPVEGETVYRRDGTESSYQPNKLFSYIFFHRVWWPWKPGTLIDSPEVIWDRLLAVYVEHCNAKKE